MAGKSASQSIVRLFIALTAALFLFEAISKQAINAVMRDLFRQLSMNGRDPDAGQSRLDDSGYFEIASNESISKDLQII